MIMQSDRLLMHPLLCSDDPLAGDLLEAYRLPVQKTSVVGVNTREGSVHVFPRKNSSESALREWIMSLQDGQLQPTSEYSPKYCRVQ